MSMPCSTTEPGPTPSSGRVARLKQAVLTARPGVCTDRALLWTEYIKSRAAKGKPVIIQMAEALSHVLAGKRIAIYPEELLVGNFSCKRVGGSIYPELHGVTVLEDIFKFRKRDTSPLEISGQEMRQLLAIVPYWLLRFLAFKAHKSPLKKWAFIAGQLKGRYYFINESGGVAHLAPDYAKLIGLGMEGLKREIEHYQQEHAPDSPAWQTHEAMKIMADGMIRFGQRYAELARQMAQEESDPARRQELLEIAEVCDRVPAQGARTLHEALQSVLFIQIAINLESLDNGICPGRMDQYLYPYYQADLAAGRLDREGAKELLGAFSVKLAELVPIFSHRITRFHGGMFNGQVVTVGGVDRQGQDATNELSMILLEVMDAHRLRQPNFHARVHPNAPPEYLDKLYGVLAGGSNTPALYNDPVIADALCRVGYAVEDARDYTAVGCVEPVCQGKSFSSTDAALVNAPILLELALNQGRRFGGLLRKGAKTPPVKSMRSMADLTAAFEAQLNHMLGRLLVDLQAVERANTQLHPTPLTSMLLDGCIANGVCSTAGGAAYNFSGIQCVGPADVGDALYAIEQAVFVDKKMALPQLVAGLKANLGDQAMRSYLRNLGKFGNDLPEVDKWTDFVVHAFRGFLDGKLSTRGGRYTTGLYSVTAHRYFGQMTGALPHGRAKGESFASGLAPVNGMDRSGPTALINSVNRIDHAAMANGINLNLKFDAHCLRGQVGKLALGSLLATYFRRGGMQTQINVMDPAVLMAARDDPELYPHLLVRVSGYSAYFNDLTPEMKDEIIRRTSLAA